MNDSQITHHAYWIYKHMEKHMQGKEYKDIIREELPSDIVREIDELVAHIKTQY